VENRREVWALYTAWTDQLRTVAKEVGTSFGESGVLALTATAVNRVLRALHQAGIPAVELSDYDGRSRDRVKVGTVKRAQGLEFTQVLMALVSSALLAVAGSDGSARIGADPRRSAPIRGAIGLTTIAAPTEPATIAGPVATGATAGAGASDDVGRERRERDRRELYVAMTRARDGLWIGLID